MNSEQLNAALAAAFTPISTESELEAGAAAGTATAAKRQFPWGAVASDSGRNDQAAAATQSLEEVAPIDRYEGFEEVGRGGMATVFRAWDRKLNREVAVKVVRDRRNDHRQVLQRFVAEAQITARLQHPGVIPIHDLGELPEQGPFIAMKLVQGQTLSELLNTSTDRRSLLRILEQVCQTMAYAHAQGVMHRDLKPSNVMVGAFGEVQVMDWGLAKLLTRPDIADDGPFPTDQHDSSATLSVSMADNDTSCDVEPVSSGSDELATREGSLLGTPAYVSPEQARGEVNVLDERTDVFGLGAVLCEVLTGATPYVADSTAELLHKAANADLADAFNRLDRCEADPELIQLVRRCLAPDPQDRPSDAGAVADALAAWRASLDDRLRQAELENVESLAKAEHERKRRWMTLVLASTVLLFGATGAGVWQWVQQDRHARDLQAEQDLHQQDLLANEEQIGALKRQLEDRVGSFSSVMRDDVFGPFNLLGGPGNLDGDALLAATESAVDTAFVDRPYLEIAARQFLANLYWSQDQPARALKHAERAVDLLTEHSGPKHPMTIEARGYLDRLLASTRRGRAPDDTSGRSLRFSQAYSDAVLSDHPIGYWRLNEEAGETISHDLSGNDCHGRYDLTLVTAEGATSFQSKGPGTRDFVSMQDFPFPKSSFSVEFWLKKDATFGSMISYAADGALGGDQNEFALTSGPELNVCVAGKWQGFPMNASDDRWHHVVVTWQQSDGAVTVYRDNSRVLEGSLPNRELVSGGCLVFGQDQEYVGGGFEAERSYQGLLAEVAVYDRVLTAEQILTHYNIRRDSVERHFDALVANSTNLVINGDFEAGGDKGFSSEYSFADGGPVSEGAYDFVTNPHQLNEAFSEYGDHTTGSGRMMFVNGGSQATDAVWSRKVSTTPQTDYVFAVYVSTAFHSNPAALEFSINDQIVGTLRASPETGKWLRYYTKWNSQSATVADVRIINKNTEVTGNDFALDDIFFGKAVLTNTPDADTINKDDKATRSTNDASKSQDGK